MRESNSHEDLAKVPGSHYINPPILWCEWRDSNPQITDFKSVAYTNSATLALILVGAERIELSTHGPKPRILPLNYAPIILNSSTSKTICSTGWTRTSKTQGSRINSAVQYQLCLLWSISLYRFLPFCGKNSGRSLANL